MNIEESIKESVKNILKVEDIENIVKDFTKENKKDLVTMFTISLTPTKNKLKISLGASIKVIK